MSSRSYFEQLHTSGADFHNSGLTESEFLAEKQLEIDILGLTDESVSSDNDSNLDGEHDTQYNDIPATEFKDSRETLSIGDRPTNMGNKHSRALKKQERGVKREIEMNEFNNVDKDENLEDLDSICRSSINTIIQSGNDELIMASLASSTNKEEIVITDTESDSEGDLDRDLNIELDREINYKPIPTSGLRRVNQHKNDKPNNQRNNNPIDDGQKSELGPRFCSSSRPESNPDRNDIVDDVFDSSSDSSIVSLVGEDNDLCNTPVKAIRKELEERIDDLHLQHVEYNKQIMDIEKYFSQEREFDDEMDIDDIADSKKVNFQDPDENSIVSKNRGSVFASKFYTKNSDLPQYASYMHLEPSEAEISFNLFDFIKEFFVVMVLHLYLGIYNAMFNVITIDGIISCLIFYFGAILGFKDSDNFLSKIRLMTLDRYIYYLLLFVGVHIVNYTTWFQYSELTRYMASFMICPSIMGQIYNIRAYSKVRQILYDGYNNLVKKIICKQLAKIINMFIENVLNLRPRVTHEDLMDHYQEFDFLVINRFIITFILALIFNHVDKGSLKIPIMIYKNLYMKDNDNKYNIKNDKYYLTRIIKDQKWEKFLDVYTLNRMIRMLIENDEKDADLSAMINAFLKRMLFRINRVMFCWTLMSTTGSLLAGVLGFILFIKNAAKPLRYLLNVAVFSGLTMITDEKILVLVLCEIFFSIADSKLIIDITRDTYGSLCRGVTAIYENTRAESIFFSMLLSGLSFFGLSWVSMLIVILINLILFIRFRSCDLNVGQVRMIATDDDKNRGKETIYTYNVDSIFGMTRDMNLSSIKNYLSMISNHLHFSEDSTTSDVKAENNQEVINYSINNNSDIIRYIIHSIRSNLLYKTLLSQNSVDKFDLYRMLGYYFFLLVFGYISGFAGFHIILLPIIIQNIVDIIW